MQTTIETLERIGKNSAANRDEIFTRLYRYMLRPDIYFVAYGKLYANKGAATKGVNEDTADGFSESKITDIIEMLSNESYQPSPVRRAYIPKKSDPTKKRPLGLPTFTDKLVQEALRMILEAVYEPIFLNSSHGFRSKRSCHTALTSLKKEFNGTRWFIEGDIKACFESINHETLIGLLREKIKDVRIINLIRKFLKAGYLEDWRYNKTYSGAPQGGIISPLLSNIYMHELDKFVMKLKSEFDTPGADKERITPEYQELHNEIRRLSYHINKSDGAKRNSLIEECRVKRVQLLKTPYTLHIDKTIKYIRYADDFILGVKGSKGDCEWIKSKLTEFISEALKMELSAEKTLITHSNSFARFLGYDVYVRRQDTVKRDKNGLTRRTLNNRTGLNVPPDKIRNVIFSKGVAVQREDGSIAPSHRNSLLHLTDLEIISVYNAELRGICNYYGIASNFHGLSHFAYLMEYSCLKTLAAKHKRKTSKVRAILQDGKGNWGVPYETKKGPKRCYFAKYSECKGNSNPTDNIANRPMMYSGTTTFESRLKAKVCELCGTTKGKFEIHHVNKVKNLKGKKQWEKIMIAKRRKTMVVCKDCHYKIHHL
jgi:group II intron reverse transcriptase/maturase